MKSKDIEAESLVSFKQGFSDGYTRALLDVQALWNVCWKYWSAEILPWKNNESEKQEAPLLGGEKSPLDN